MTGKNRRLKIKKRHTECAYYFRSVATTLVRLERIKRSAFKYLPLPPYLSVAYAGMLILSTLYPTSDIYSLLRKLRLLKTIDRSYSRFWLVGKTTFIGVKSEGKKSRTAQGGMQNWIGDMTGGPSVMRKRNGFSEQLDKQKHGGSFPGYSGFGFIVWQWQPA